MEETCKCSAPDKAAVPTKCAQDYLGNYLDPTVQWEQCMALTSLNTCEHGRPDSNQKIFRCAWQPATCSDATKLTQGACVSPATWAADHCEPYLDQKWGCTCVEFKVGAATRPWPDLLVLPVVAGFTKADVSAATTDDAIAQCTSAENDPQYGMAVVYCFLLLWSFSGVGIIADVFMEAIAVITSSSTLVEKRDDKSGDTHQIEIMTWNATVANLTLMALGSSAPEILLSVIEIVSGSFYSGALGPSTIVGSAAFNMLVILGICVMCIPAKNDATGETGTRQIADMNVFAITAFSSVFAYVWLLVILMMITPNVVDLWESLLTFLFFPILVLLAWLADAGYFSKRNKVTPQSVTGIAVDGDSVGTFRPNEVKSLLKAEGHRDILTTDPVELEALAEAAYYKSKPKTRADYRIEATRELTGSKPKYADMSLSSGDGRARRSWIGWQCTQLKVAEAVEFAECIIERSGNMEYDVTFKIETQSGTATAGDDFHHVSQSLTLKAGEDSVSCKIPIKSDDKNENNEHFTVVISEASEHGVEIEAARTECVITIVEDSTPTILRMAETEEEGLTASYKCYESDGRVLVKVSRTGGCSAAVSCQYATKEGTATANMDYKESTGTLEFGPGETCKFIEIEIIDDDQFENDEDFTVSISDPVGAEIGGVKVATITIVNDDEMTDVVERVSNLLKINMDKYKVGSASYSQQFKDAIEMPDGCGDKIAHLINLPFKVIFAICPPPAICGGWLCFNISLCLIGVTTAVIGDLAALFGCSVGMKDAVTAITFVALGTSLPDTFASKAAAIGDKTADSSVGNVTGSNSVNVFLGLGMPWLMASIYWMIGDKAAGTYLKAGGWTFTADDQKMTKGVYDLEFVSWNDYLLKLNDKSLDLAQYQAIMDMPCATAGGCFVVPAGDLGFSVIIFGLCAMMCLGGLVLRRKLYGYELGGTAATPFGVSFIMLWFFYVVMSTMKSYSVF